MEVISRDDAAKAVNGVARLTLEALDKGKSRNFDRLMRLWLAIAKYADDNKSKSDPKLAQAYFVSAEQHRLVSIAAELGIADLFSVDGNAGSRNPGT